MSDTKRVLVVGWDAADWKMIHPLMDQGLMPAVKRMVETGVMGNLATLSPVFSPMLWTSIATGKRPYKHGILGFIEPTPDGSSVQPVTGLSRKTKAIWNILSQEGKRCLVVGWWPSHPAEPIQGVMVSNHYQRAPKGIDPRWPMAPGTVFPPRLAEELAELRVHPLELGEEHIRPFIPHAEKIDQDKDRRLDSCLRIIADCTSIHSCMTHLLEHEPWDFAAVYYDAIDHFGHGFMKYHPPRQGFVSEEDFEIYQNVVAAGYVYHDMMLARLMELAGADTTLILVSDHGFHPDHLRPDGMPVEPAGPAIEHRDLGILAMCGPAIKQDHLICGATLLDVTPTILALLGLPVGEDMDGHPLLDAFQHPVEVRRIPSWDQVPGADGQHPAGHRLDAEQSRQTMEQLIALGYVEPPEEDQAKTVAKAERELSYNLALSYMDAGMHPKAAEVLAELYRDYPLEFRFGIRLAVCLQAMQLPEEMAAVVDHLRTCWGTAAERARARLRRIAEVGKERRKQLREERERGEQAGLGEETRDAVPGSLPAGGKKPGRLFDEAEQRVIRELRAIARGNARTLDYLASSIAMSRKDYRGALHHLDRARESATRTPGFHLQVGHAYLALRRLDEAERSYRRVLELDPENPDAFLGLGRIELRRGRNPQALAAARTAVGLKYHFPAAHFYLGIARHRTGDLRAAIASLDLAIAQNPNFAEAHSRLALIYEQGLQDRLRASAHRTLAVAIRRERRHGRQARPGFVLPDLAAIDLDASLPELPQPVEGPLESKRKPSLGMTPIVPAAGGRDADARPLVRIVSGLPRSGTSMMMQMLAAGGLPVLSDGERAADGSNPRGYFELEKVKQLQSDNRWLGEAEGKAIKVVAPLLPYLPQDCRYQVLLLERDIGEIVASQGKMLERLGRAGGKLDAEQLAHALGHQLERAKVLLAAHQVPVLVISYQGALASPATTARRVAEFLGVEMDRDAMARAVDPSLYRERKG